MGYIISGKAPSRGRRPFVLFADRREESVLQRGAGRLGGVDDAGLDQTFENAGKGVVTAVLALRFEDSGDDDGLSSPAFVMIWRGGSSSERRTIWAPIFPSTSSVSMSSLTAGTARTSATPPPRTMPSSTATRAASRASSTRALYGRADPRNLK
jgi:hypothetical protein